MAIRKRSSGESGSGTEGGQPKRGPRNYHELGKLGGEARKRQLMGGGRSGEE